MIKRNMGLYDEERVRQTIEAMFPPGRVFEVRIIRNNRKGGISGYFKTADDVIKAFDTVDLRNTNVYMTLNVLDESCFDMVQQNKFVDGATTTQDTDVKYYDWLFIDLDPKRKSGLSSTDEQRDAAFKLAQRVESYLQQHGFSEPVKAVSGNGAHLLYHVALANTDENEALIQRCLKALDLLFSTDVVDIDISTFNPARICKLYGTLAQKGANSATRPHRMSYIFSVPDKLMVTPKNNLEWLASQLPQEEPQTYPHDSHSEFDIEHWLTDHGIGYSTKAWRDGAVKYVLDECPFNHEHKAPDSCVIKQNSGAIGFKCLHNSCQGKTWKDLRLMYEPEAYSYAERKSREIEQGWNRHERTKAEDVREDSNEDDFSNEAKFLDAPTVFNRKEPESEYISTGVDGIDNAMKGLQKGRISVLSGLRSSAKSTWLSQLMLNVVNANQTVVCYSGELDAKGFFKWMSLQAAGKKYVVPLSKFHNAWTVKDEATERRISEWLGDRLWLYNNIYGNNANMVIKSLAAKVKETNASLVVVDNLMAVNLEFSKDKYDAQTQFVWDLKRLAKECNTHVIFVAHPRKTTDFLRLMDISGTANIGNIVDNAFIIHRNNNDFDKAIAEYLGKKRNQYIVDGCTNVIEVCKDRENGTQDLFVPLWYEPETKRLLTTENEYVHYGWETSVPNYEPTYDADDDNPF